jgi:hypothetical protein
MGIFDDRTKGFEDKFRHDQELAFKITARRNRLLGLWAADRLGLSGETAEAYAKEVLSADFEKPGETDLVEKLMRDFAAKGIGITEAQIRQEMHRLTIEARKQLTSN